MSFFVTTMVDFLTDLPDFPGYSKLLKFRFSQEALFCTNSMALPIRNACKQILISVTPV